MEENTTQNSSGNKTTGVIVLVFLFAAIIASFNFSTSSDLSIENTQNFQSSGQAFSRIFSQSQPIEPSCIPTWYCIDSVTRAYKNSDCQPTQISECGLNGVCSEGYCNSCTDTDGGTNLQTRATVYGLNSGNEFNYLDTCTGNTLTEYACDGVSPVSSEINCLIETGDSCNDGACGLPETNTYAFVTSWGGDKGAFSVINVSNPSSPDGIADLGRSEDPELLGQPLYPTSVYIQNTTLDPVTSNGDIAYLVGGFCPPVFDCSGYPPFGQPALVTVDVSNPYAPNGLGMLLLNEDPDLPYDPAFRPFSVQVQGNYAYVVGAGIDRPLLVIDVSNPYEPDGVSYILLANDQETSTAVGAPSSIEIQGNYAYVLFEAGNAFVVVDISNPLAPDGRGVVTNSDPEISTLNVPQDLDVAGNYAYVVNEGGQSLTIIDISNPSAPNGVAQITRNDPQIRSMLEPWAVFVAGNYAYVGGFRPGYSGGSLAVIDISDPLHPDGVGQVTNSDPEISDMVDFSGIGASGETLYVLGDYAYGISTGTSNLAVIDISNPSAPDGVGQVSAFDPEINRMGWTNSIFVYSLNAGPES